MMTRRMPDKGLPPDGWILASAAPPRTCSWDDVDLVTLNGLLLCPVCDSAALAVMEGQG